MPPRAETCVTTGVQRERERHRDRADGRCAHPALCSRRPPRPSPSQRAGTQERGSGSPRAVVGCVARARAGACDYRPTIRLHLRIGDVLEPRCDP